MARASQFRVRLYYPDPRFVKMRIRNDSAHEPSNPSPQVLQGAARQLWQNVEGQAFGIYGEHAGPHEIPEKTAWKAVRMQFQKNGNSWVKRKHVEQEIPYILPNPGDTAWLGKFIEYAWITPKGEVYKRTFNENPPDLWWNKDQKTLYSFPTAVVPDQCLVITPDLNDTAEMFKTWSQRNAKCANKIDVPMARMYPRGATDSVSYRSDKWHDENPDPRLEGSGEYIHMHGDGVWVWEDTEDLRDTPNAIMIRGGRLDVEERGIIH